MITTSNTLQIGRNLKLFANDLKEITWQSREINALGVKSLTDSCWITFLAQGFFTLYVTSPISFKESSWNLPTKEDVCV